MKRIVTKPFKNGCYIKKEKRMNVDTRQIYVGTEEIEAAKERGENLIELSDGITKQMYSIEQAQALAKRSKLHRRPHVPMRAYDSEL